jgi:superfamily II DNA/RNA helicase
MKSFSELGLDEALAAAMASLGFPGPTGVQERAIPAILTGRDILMESETGTGKTFAYLAPALQYCSAAQGRSNPLVLVAAPTQELAVQIGREAERLARAASIELRSVVILGGTPLSRQAGILHGGPSLVIGTLGRLADHVALGTIKTSSLRLLVLDEADRLLENETEDTVTKMIARVPRSCARVLVSATLPKRARERASPFLREPESISVEAERAVLAGDIEHWCFYCDGRKRVDFIRRFEAAVRPERCLVFLSTAARVASVAERLEAMGLPAASMQARDDKEERRVSLERFAEGKIRYLVTSDLGARGLDIPGISHVISLDFPEEPTVYIHRAGRTGRAGQKGVSVILADGVELRRASKLAVREGFVFRCKLLEVGKVWEPEPEDFFARVEAAEAERAEHRAHRLAEGSTRFASGPAHGAQGRGDPRDGRRPMPRDASSRNARPHNAPSHNPQSYNAKRQRRGPGDGRP